MILKFFAVVSLLYLCQDPWGAEGTGLRERECHSVGAGSCEECLAAGPFCAWCVEESFLGSSQRTWERCSTADVLLARGCPPWSVEDPRGDVVLLHDCEATPHNQDQRSPTDRITQLRPQQVLLHLRPGEPQAFEIKFRRVEDHPIDLYYLMDLSFSMEDDLPNVKKMGTDLIKEMKNITQDFRLGFGAFVDKTVMPYISTSKHLLDNPCKRPGPRPCARAFGFRHVLGLTQNGSQFAELVGRQHISGNLDLPEGGLDALMQAAVCEEHIGWRNVTRLLVFSTDAGFHFAGDGKLGGIVLPNDGRCHLENNMYTMSQHQDYPSLAHLAEKLKEKNIQTIFAVTEDVLHLYEGLKDIFPKCTIGTLSNNSHNILQLIVNAYNALTSEVIMDNSELPPGYQIVYSTSCKDHVVRAGDDGRRCSNISIGDEVTFTVSITAPSCEAGQEEARVVIKPQGFSEKVEVLLRPVCQCQCSQGRVVDSPRCGNGSGALECGACRCKEGHVGTFCECEAGLSDEAGMREQCRRDNSSEVCSGHGDCVCGECVCHEIRRNPGHTFYGKYCQCDDFHCDQHQGLPCGGQGQCECGTCQCFPGFSGTACECPISTEACVSQIGLLCSDRGQCVCGACLCQDSRFLGPTCEICPSCPGVCAEHRECVLCVAHARGLEEGGCTTVCGQLNLTLVAEPAHLQQGGPASGLHWCREEDADGCWVHFLYQAEQKGSAAHIYAALGRECLVGPDVVVITFVVSGSVVLLGLAVLLLWKLVAIFHDRREFARFQRELGEARWGAGVNPIYKSAVTTILNPKYKAQ